MEHFVVMQVKEKEINYKRLREENEFAQKVHSWSSIIAVVQLQSLFLIMCSN